MDGARPIWLVNNASSGSNDDKALQALNDSCSANGLRVAHRTIFPEQDLPTPAILNAAEVDTVAVFAGDGTVHALLEALSGWNGAVLVLPGGTTNLLSKALHGDRPVTEIVADVAAMKATRRTCIRSQAGTGYIEVLAGPGAKWSEVREELREDNLVEVASKTVEAARESAGGAMVALTDPPLGKPEGYAGIRLTPTETGMEIEGYGADTIGDYLRHGVALLKRDFREGPHDELGTQREVTCAVTEGQALDLMIDGERCVGGAEMRFSLAEVDLDLLASA